jgi:hypothetical protein
MSWNDLKDALADTYREGNIELSDEEIKEFLPEYIKHVNREKEKEDIYKRKLYQDKTGTYICALRFPTKQEFKQGKASDITRASNEAQRWWGPKLALLNDKKITVFFPKDWKISDQFGWTQKGSKKWLFVYRGVMKIDYTWAGEDDYLSEKKFIKSACERFGTSNIKSIEDIEANDRWWSEVGVLSFTFNPNQFLTTLK